jgi:two-component system, NarL family, nitrate/nitrite response regulator NarL
LSKHSIATVVVEQRTLLREGVCSLLQHSSYKVIASTPDLSNIARLSLPSFRPALLILGLPQALDYPAESFRSSRSPGSVTKIIVVAETAEPDDVQAILRNAVDGVILNIRSRDVFLNALDLAFLGQKFAVFDQSTATAINTVDAAPTLAPDGMSSIPDKGHGDTTWVFVRERLSERERQILACLARGDPNKLIAKACSITEATVKVHLKTILRKIARRNRTQAAIWAHEHGLSTALQPAFPLRIGTSLRTSDSE